MRHSYAFFLAGLGLLLNLAACSTKPDSEGSNRRTSEPLVAPAVAQPASDSSQTTSPNTSPRGNTVLAPASELSPNPVPTTPPRDRRRATRLMRQPRPLATPAVVTAATPPTETVPAAAGVNALAAPTNKTAETPAPTDTPKTAQVFLIRPDRDTVLYGAEGTVMRVPAGTFVQGPGKETAPKGLIEVQLREFYSMADILLERLSTMAGPKLLETGGMVQLSATANGRECKLRPGSAFELGFPATRPIDGMQLYAGQATATHGLNWKLTPQPKVTKRKAWSKSQHWHQPHFKGGYWVTRHRLRKTIAYAPATALQLNGNQPPRQLRRELRRKGQRAPVVGTVEASFELSENGTVNDVFVRNPSRADSALRAAVFQALRRLTADPSHRERVATRSMMKVDVRFTADGRVLVDHLRWDRATTLALYQADTERKARGKSRLTDAQLQAAPLDVVTGELFQKRQGNAKRYSVKTFLSEQLNYAKELAVFRVGVVVAPRAVGWYNCDRPAPPLLARLTMRSNVKAPRGGLAKLALVRLGLEQSAAQPADISLVLRDKRCVIRGDAKEGRITFEQLADSTVATLVAIRREQGQLYLAMRDVVVRQRVEPALDFRPVTVAELKTAVARFDL